MLHCPAKGLPCRWQTQQCLGNVLCRHLDTPRVNLDVLCGHLDIPRVNLDVLRRHLDTPRVILDVLHRHLDTPRVILDVLCGHLDTPRVNLDVLRRHLDTPRVNLDVLRRHLDTPRVNLDVLRRHRDVLHQGGAALRGSGVKLTRLSAALASGLLLQAIAQLRPNELRVALQPGHLLGELSRHVLRLADIRL